MGIQYRVATSDGSKRGSPKGRSRISKLSKNLSTLYKKYRHSDARHRNAGWTLINVVRILILDRRRGTAFHKYDFKSYESIIAATIVLLPAHADTGFGIYAWRIFTIGFCM